MTNKQALHENKTEIVSLFKKALQAKIDMLGALADIGNIVGDIDGCIDDIEEFAVNCVTPEELRADIILSTVENWLCDPDGEELRCISGDFLQESEGLLLSKLQSIQKGNINGTLHS